MGVSPVVRPGGAWLIVTLGALSSFGPLCLDMYLPALPQLPGDLSSTAGAAQLTLSACIVGLGVGQLITGPASDRFGRRGPLLIGVAVFVAASVICAVTTSMTLLIVTRLVQGAAGAAGIVVGRAVVADLFAGKVAAAYFSAIAAINGLAPILAPVIGGQVLRVGTWRTVFWVLAGIGVAHAAAGLFRDPRDAAAGAAVVRRDDRRPAGVRHAAARSRVHRHGAGRANSCGSDTHVRRFEFGFAPRFETLTREPLKPKTKSVGQEASKTRTQSTPGYPAPARCVSRRGFFWTYTSTPSFPFFPAAV